MKATTVQFQEVMARLDEGDFTKDGVPKMDPLNDRLLEAGFEIMTRGERDEMIKAMDAESIDAPAEAEELLLFDSRYDPLTVPVNGKVMLSMRIGEIKAVSPEVRRVAEDAGAIFKPVNDEGKVDA